MKKYFIFAALAAVALAACAKIETNEVATVEEPLSFGVYVPKAVTKAGSVNVLDNAELQNTGFGVFAAYTDGADYATNAKMNFMWNQHVTYGTSWEYTPVKYWPNEHGASAISTGVDKLSFFAYAPYVASTDVANGTVDNNTWGITRFTGNGADGDPKVSYVYNPTHPVDLTWGVVDQNKTWTDAEGTDLTLTAGLPYKNLIKPTGTPKVKFLFKHALAKVVVNVQAVEAGAGVSNIGLANGTRIFIRDLKINGTNVFNSGTLNLNNTTANTPLWEVGNTADGSINVDITTKTKLYIDAKPSGWDDAWTPTDKPGVTTTVEELYNGMTIPTVAGTGITEVVIVYDVITKDDNLVGSASVVENNIKKAVTTNGFDQLLAGYVYTLNLKLGMKTVDLDADITAWDATTYNTEVNLPTNN